MTKKDRIKEQENSKKGAKTTHEPDLEDSKDLTQEESLIAEIEKLKTQIEELNDKYIRNVAEFDNYRRRTAKERLDMIATAGKDILVGFLPVLDDCERAIKVLKESDASQAAIEGTDLIYTKLTTYLKSKGMLRIEALGQTFNTDFHEAVAQLPAQDSEFKNKVIDVVLQGYTLNGKVVRYAKVVVGV
ncbi:MAG: nucleotide exchange factor GrpE [Bacteroidales bacterium]|jgi:molecular chaperone GrpE|nr:nucleotide exchange factor GrpE [Bacteroidales bacterium]